jgi:hypothetical protein
METKKIERVPGTTYVKIDNSVFNTVPKEVSQTKAQCLCLWCGDKFGANAAGQCAIYCKNCKKVEGRKQIKEQNEAIDEENKAKGYK